MVIRPGSRRTGCDGSRSVSSCHGWPPDGSAAGGGGTAAAGTAPDGSIAPLGSSSLHTGDWLENDDHTSRSSLGSGFDAVGRTRGTSPVGGSVQCGNEPVSASPKDRSPGFTSVVGTSPNSGGPKSSSSSRPCRRQASSLMQLASSHARNQTSSSSCSLRPDALSISSTWSWVIFS